MSLKNNHLQSCMISRLDETMLWYRKHGYLNLRGIRTIVSEKAIIGLLNLKIEEGKIYEECEIGN